MYWRLPFWRFVHWRIIEAIEELRIHFTDARHHLANHKARFRRRVTRRVHPPEPMQDDARKRVHHGCKSGHRQNVTRDFDRAFFRLTFHFLHALRM